MLGKRSAPRWTAVFPGAGAHGTVWAQGHPIVAAPAWQVAPVISARRTVSKSCRAHTGCWLLLGVL